jgi:hypothetical protein
MKKNITVTTDAKSSALVTQIADVTAIVLNSDWIIIMADNGVLKTKTTFATNRVISIEEQESCD